MKKNIVGHMVAPSDKRTGFFDKLDLVPRILCLLLAFLIWLFVVDFNEDQQKASTSEPETVETDA